MQNSKASDHLRLAALFFAFGTAVHWLDHFRRGQGSVTDLVLAIGSVGQVAQIVAITLAVTRHRLAGLTCAAVGLPVAAGIAVIHWTPDTGPWSDPVWHIASPAASYVASTLEILGALTIGVLGLRLYRTEAARLCGTEGARISPS